MQKNFIKISNNILVKYTFFTFLLLTAIFGRSFMGIYLFGLRFGEYLVGVAFGLFLIFLFNKYLVDNLFGKNIYLNLFLLFVTFILFLFLNDDFSTNTYLFRSSSYIWVTSFILFGYFFTNNLVLNQKILIFNNFLLILMFYLNTIGYPDILIDFLKNMVTNFNLIKPQRL